MFDESLNRQLQNLTDFVYARARAGPVGGSKQFPIPLHCAARCRWVNVADWLSLLVQGTCWLQLKKAPCTP